MCEDSESVERILHIEEMKAELRELSDGQAIIETVDDELPLEVEEKFFEHVLAFERAEMVSHRDLLEGNGVVLPAPEELGDGALAQKLNEVIQALAEQRIYLLNTDHLSDRELYAQLCADILDEIGPLLPPEAETNCRIDLVSSGSEEDIELWLTYYADEEDRADWLDRFPDDHLPPHVDPPYDRDQYLPAPPDPWAEGDEAEA